MVAGLGTLVAAHGEVRFVWRGVLAMTASQFTEASKLVPSRVDMESHRVPSSAAAVPLTLTLTLGSGSGHAGQG